MMIMKEEEIYTVLKELESTEEYENVLCINNIFLIYSNITFNFSTDYYARIIKEISDPFIIIINNIGMLKVELFSMKYNYIPVPHDKTEYFQFQLLNDIPYSYEFLMQVQDLVLNSKIGLLFYPEEYKSE